MAETNNRYEALDGLRGVAALAVMISTSVRKCFSRTLMKRSIYFSC